MPIKNQTHESHACLCDNLIDLVAKLRLANKNNKDKLSALFLTDEDIDALATIMEQPTNSYLALFNYAKQPKVAQSLLIYACHLHYLFIRLGIEEKEIAECRCIVKPVAQEVYSRVCKFLRIPVPTRKEILARQDAVCDKLAEVFVEPFYKNLFDYIGKETRNV